MTARPAAGDYYREMASGRAGERESGRGGERESGRGREREISRPSLFITRF
jgi:hypothetical protein